MGTFSFDRAIGEIVTIKHDPTKTPKKIRAINIGETATYFLVDDTKHSSYELEKDLEPITTDAGNKAGSGQPSSYSE